ncbi:ABC transporter permease [Ruania halotolerans]|uniref:ABC transporter permease n=1 Tax=Ruania halotolerans TaxID=2897773 RepID=UPI001E49DB00|nr:ABC transporter permease [Ruania halotolerans]UFU07564.1 ABC transporter permease [Ruania halotolerans]
MSRRTPAEDTPRSELAVLATEHGLRQVGGRPSLRAYIRQLWVRRAFLWTMASSRSYGKNQNNYLGQVWAVLSPLTLAAVYYLVFGVLLERVRDGVDNYVGFLTVGVFIFSAMASTITSGSTAITSNMNLVRALHFPRAILPISVALAEAMSLVPTIAVMLVIVLATEQVVSWSWLLLPVAVVLFFLFSAGVAMIAARLVVGARDLRNLIPMAIRLLRYVSGVFFLISSLDAPRAVAAIMEYQPVALYLTLVRSSVLSEFSPRLDQWLMGAGWAIATAVIGFIVFWQAEDRYGRD